MLRSTWAAGAGASIILAVLTCILTPAAAHAQRGKAAPEFTRQGLLITNFVAGPGYLSTMGLGPRKGLLLMLMLCP